MLASGKSQKLAGQLRSSFGSTQRRGAHPGDTRVVFSGQCNRLCLADHDGEQVVEIVGDPARQLTDSLQPLRLLQRRLDLPAPLHSYFQFPRALFDSFFQDDVHVAKRRLGPLAFGDVASDGGKVNRASRRRIINSENVTKDRYPRARLEMPKCRFAPPSPLLDNHGVDLSGNPRSLLRGEVLQHVGLADAVNTVEADQLPPCFIDIDGTELCVGNTDKICRILGYRGEAPILVLRLSPLAAKLCLLQIAGDPSGKLTGPKGLDEVVVGTCFQPFDARFLAGAG